MHVYIWNVSVKDHGHSLHMLCSLAVVRLSTSEKYMDRVNMYASFYVGIRAGAGNAAPYAIKLPSWSHQHHEFITNEDPKLHSTSPNSVLEAAL